jgi:hypothetical protein
MSAQHTPGPWLWQHWPDDVDPVAEASTLGTIATLQATDEGQANARLIAAAPELLAALQALHANMHAQNLDNEMERTTEASYQKAMRDAAAAVAKAVGSAS